MPTGKRSTSIVRTFPKPIVPSYLLERDQSAAQAGLAMERSISNRACAQSITIYRGTRAQILASAFVMDPEQQQFPKGRVPVGTGLNCPMIRFRDNQMKLYSAGVEEFYLKVCDVLPVREDVVADGVRSFLFESEHMRELVYLGSRDALLAAGVVTEAHFPDDECPYSMYRSNRCQRSNGRYWSTWETYEIRPDHWSFTRDLNREDELAQLKQADRERNLYSFKNVDQFREHLRARLVAELNVLLEPEFYVAETRSGLRYKMDPDDLARIRDDIEEVANELLTVPVSVKRLEARTNSSVPAQSLTPELDSEFQRFRLRLIQGGRA